MLNRLIAWGFFAAVLCSGCGGEKDEPSATADVNLEGNWLLTITQQYQEGHYRDVTTVLLGIKQKDGKLTAEIKGNKPAMPGPRLRLFEVAKDEVHLRLTSGPYTYDFVGKVDGSVIRGNMDQGGLIIEPAMLTRRQIFEIAEAEDFPFPANYAEYQSLVQKASDPETGDVSLAKHFSAFSGFCKSHPNSPLSVIIYHSMLRDLPEIAKTDAEVKMFADSYFQQASVWGNRMRTLAKYLLGKRLTYEEQFVDLGLKYVDEAMTEMGEDRRAELTEEIANLKRNAERNQLLVKAVRAREMITAGGVEEGLGTLRKLNEQSPYDPVFMFHVAEAARETDNIDEAIQFNARLTMWPLMQPTLQRTSAWLKGERKLPQSWLEELWNTKHGSPAGLEEYKAKIYDEATSRIVQEIGDPQSAAAGNRASLMELFTGAGCGPCVGADLATGALEEIYSPAHLIVLRYHVHSPVFDPLTNPRNMERFRTLLGPDPNAQMATPSVFLNGSKVETNVGGYLTDAAEVGKDLKQSLAPFLDENTPLTLKLSAYEHEGEITISANLTGVPANQKDQLRVRLLLAEQEVDFPARNGIQRHEMLVRWFINDGASLAISSAGDFQYMTKITAKEIREFLETSTKSAADHMEAEIGQLPLELKNMRLVAVVEDAKTGEVLQAAVAPVEVYDTSPMSPTVPGPSFPGKKPSTGPMLVLPKFGAKNEPAQAEKPDQNPQLLLPKLPD